MSRTARVGDIMSANAAVTGTMAPVVGGTVLSPLVLPVAGVSVEALLTLIVAGVAGAAGVIATTKMEDKLLQRPFALSTILKETILSGHEMTMTTHDGEYSETFLDTNDGEHETSLRTNDGVYSVTATNEGEYSVRAMQTKRAVTSTSNSGTTCTSGGESRNVSEVEMATTCVITCVTSAHTTV